MDNWQRVRLTSDFIFGAEKYAPGAVVSLPAVQAEKLVDEGRAVPVGHQSATDRKTRVVTAPNNAARIMSRRKLNAGRRPH